MRLFDSHCHLDDEMYRDDLDRVIENARDAGVRAIMNVGITVDASRKVIAIAEANPNIFASVAIHPHDVKDASEEGMEILKELASSEKVRAWGETGLDFNRMYSPRDLQEKWFLRQMELAEELGLPVILHERDSNGRLGDMLKSHKKNWTGVVHCFSGSHRDLDLYLDLGFHIGITGILTQKERGAPLREQVGAIPRDRLLIETDAPYLTPMPERKRVRRNEPAFVRSVMLKLAGVLNEDPDTLSETIWTNTCTLFHCFTP